ncbi:MAG TPA: acetyl-CoA carboxylase biotin carboxylase subunit [Candidatus Omnitrophica bacterium]|nr:MAG: acetyl-CoA carboxylase biotin carboxylase subunit [Omnitrophica WOR_2 bacterium GWA2_63_20]OGX18946.1 MAG: acetyl-CoA carboxylase biotin carboxylase subunit [Omnitrophica WOR_2 bacterium GWF2_63_9]OGX35906.1 MAG: acetyl-CoA carboxylase biotin carboxylase subunit [Omnitrophica WOR_2 bacterium RIFCSPHIGHO2_02_FULL_63_39]OGX45351.1 MAG: acetyl-CoA carboxylase biotin carboxylase subunit [Omnitrophica WOR_2 bacterium RIFCSPLOWO2_02_FULL_63_16]OGX49134.1 MAG: acetyl-CoA carboxylase biotin car
MFSKILIANRGEIAVRVIRACKEMGIKTVAVYSEADRNAWHVRMAEEAVCIGGPKPEQSYLNIPAIISAAEITDVDAIHPGYGFLSEHAHFAEICDSCNITFIGPSAKTIRLLGDKIVAKDLMRKAGVPIIPGSLTAVKNKEEALNTARRIQYPVMLKAAAGGGGRGMRACHNDVRLISALMTCQAEAQASFGNSEIFVEKYVEQPRHVEFQILADRRGHLVHLGERDCTIQRRHQKLIEESPSPAVDAKLRRKMGEMAIRVAKAANYSTVGTVEFLLDRGGNFYFIEVNTRIQVEHPVTEMVTGLDLVKEQIRLAAGESLNMKQEDVRLDGWAIECRINAADPSNGFAPSPGRIQVYHEPGGPGVRVDTHVFAGYEIPPFYDSLLAKLITHGRTRQEAIRVMQRSLDEFLIEPIRTTIPLHKQIFSDPTFWRGHISTDYVEQLLGIREP